MTSFIDEQALDAAEAAQVDEEHREPVEEPEQPPSSTLAVPEPSHEIQHLAPSDLPIVPPDQEMRALVQLAVTLSAAELVPRALRDKPNDVLLVLLTARDLGIKLTTALRLCYPIEGQVSVAPKLKLAIIRERGIARVWPDPANDDHAATWYAVRADDPDTTFASTFTWEQAQRTSGKGQLVDNRCSPEQHAGGCKCKDNWRNWPARMLSWRALGYLMDDACGEVGAGLYAPDELGAITDEEGTAIIDVTDVGPLQGTAEPRSMARRRQQAERGPSEGDMLAPEPDRQLIGRMLRALPQGGVEAGVALWPEAVGHKVDNLPNKRVRAARALVDSLWKRAAGGEWGEWAAPFDPDASEPLSEPESVSGAEGAPNAPEGSSEPSSGQSGDAEPDRDPELPDLGDLDAVIDHVQALSLDQVQAWIERATLEPERDAESDKRRAVAVHIAGALGLL